MAEKVVLVPPADTSDEAEVDVGAAAAEKKSVSKKLVKVNADRKVVKDDKDCVGAFDSIVGIVGAVEGKEKGAMGPPRASWTVVKESKKQKKPPKRRKMAEKAASENKGADKEISSDTTITGYDVTSDTSSVDEMMRPKMISSPLQSLGFMRDDEV